MLILICFSFMPSRANDTSGTVLLPTGGASI